MNNPDFDAKKQPGFVGTAHWSTDYVEHLRTVHFTLVAVCVALIVLSTSRAPTEVQMAYSQVSQIRELLRSYDRAWLTEHAQNRIKEGIKAEAAVLKSQGISATNTTVEFQQDGIVRRLPFSTPSLNFVVRSLRDTQKPRKTSQDHSYPLPDELDIFPNQWSKGLSLTLQQFHQFWDSLGDDFYIFLPATVDSNAIIIPDYTGEDYTDLGIIPVKFSKAGQHQEECAGWERAFFVGAYSEVTVNRLKAKNSGFQGEYFYGCTIRAPESLQAKNIIEDAEVDSTELFTLPIPTTVSVPYDGQSALMSHTRSVWNWRHGKFDHAFQQLSDITKNYEDLDLSKIEQILAEEKRRAGESFEAVGIKFPADNATRWGILVIIGLQVYFWIHLRERSPKLHRSDPGWEVAWIGVYPSKYAKAAMFVSTCLLPPAAAAALGVRGLQISSFGLDCSSWPYWCLLLGGTLCASVLGYLAWKELPRTNQA